MKHALSKLEICLQDLFYDTNAAWETYTVVSKVVLIDTRADTALFVSDPSPLFIRISTVSLVDLLWWLLREAE